MFSDSLLLFKLFFLVLLYCVIASPFLCSYTSRMAALYLIVAVWFVVLSLGDPRTEFVCDRVGGPAYLADATPYPGGEAFVMENPTTAHGPFCFLSGFQYCRTVPCSELFDTALNLLCCRQSRTKYFFVLARTRSRRTVFLAFLLLLAGVESNPGPETTSSSATNFGLINARSMIQKTALIHDVISDSRLDLLAVTETWVYENSPDVHKKDAAPAGFSIVHAHRSIAPHTRGKQHGGGVALIHREDIRVRVIPTPPTHTFEILLVKVINCTIGLTIAVIYRPPSTKLTDFVTELSDLIDTGSLGPRYIICGDLNCPGPSGTKGLVGKELLEVIDGYSLTQHVVSPTHQSDNLLDHIGMREGCYCHKCRIIRPLSRVKSLVLSPVNPSSEQLSETGRDSISIYSDRESGCHLSVNSPLLQLMATPCSSRKTLRAYLTNSHRSARAPSDARNQRVAGCRRKQSKRNRLGGGLNVSGRQQVWMRLGKHTGQHAE